MNILLTGAGGRVGSYLSPKLKKEGHQVICWGRTQADMNSPRQWESALDSLLANSQIDHVINCAAISSLETCVDDPVSAHKINAMAAEALGRRCERMGMKFIHFSTDYVLDGRRKGKKSESDKCKPINVYGESKYEAELRLADVCPDAVIVRVSWVFGNPEAPAFPESIIAKAIAGDPITAIADKYSLPTSLETISEAIHALLQNPEITGTYHLCNSGDPITWFDYAQATLTLAESLNFPIKTKEVIPIQQDSLKSFRDPRPIHTAMNNEKTSNHLNIVIPHWQASLEKYLLQAYS